MNGDVYTIRVGPTLQVGGGFSQTSGNFDQGMVQIFLAPGTVDAPAPPSDAVARVSLAAAPNPVTTAGTLRFSLPGAGVVSLSLYDATGRRVARVLDGERLQAGAHQAALDAEALSPGLYFAQLEVDARVAATRKVLVLR